MIPKYKLFLPKVFQFEHFPNLECIIFVIGDWKNPDLEAGPKPPMIPACTARGAPRIGL